MKPDQINAVYAGTLDYRDGQWVNECSPHSPRNVDQVDQDSLDQEYFEEHGTP